MISPGEFDSDDFRQSKPSLTIDPSSRLRVCQWNIERGYQIDRLVDELRKLDCDIIALQEIDVGCERSGLIDGGRMIARALSLNYVYLSEFIEIRSDKRSPLQQGGGHHGHAILTKYDIVEFGTVEHSVQPVNWAVEGEQRGEPRIGKRISMKAAIRVPMFNIDVLVYNAHFEVFCGVRARLQILADLFDDARKSSKQYPHQIIAMDANTMAHSIARLSSKYCCDAERVLSIGWTESELWAKYVLAFFDSDGPKNQSLSRFVETSDDSLLVRCRNPGFIEPFDVYEDVTLYNHHGLFQAKLDWLMVRGLAVQSKSMGNHDYKASDHKWLMIEINLEQTDFSKRIRSQHAHLTRRSPGLFTFSSGLTVATIAWTCLAVVVACAYSLVY